MNFYNDVLDKGLWMAKTVLGQMGEGKEGSAPAQNLYRGGQF